MVIGDLFIILAFLSGHMAGALSERRKIAKEMFGGK
jgi:hypothetical protein